MKHASTRRARAGFTLIELLAVILILSILATILVTQLRSSEEAARAQATAQLLVELEGALHHYENEFGRFPPSSFAPDQDVSNDGENVGAEALVVALWSRGFNAGGLLEKHKDRLINSDGDSSSRQLTDLGNRQLFELPDLWENPIAYIERADYGLAGRFYRTYLPGTGEESRSVPLAFKNPRTGLFFQADSFQLVSAGPDGLFGSEDDITTFERD
jgi:prepilin-type N-terminal cleavage/methylation domain-containing protein